MDFDQLYPGRFMKAGEFLGKDVTLTIASVVLDELEGKKGNETKAIMSFKETKKQLVLNKTNGTCVKAMFGRETNAWAGKRVTFYPAKIVFEDNELAIRVRGSPDLPAPIDIDTMIGRRKLKTTLAVTRRKGAPANGNGKAADAAQTSAPATKPAPAAPPECAEAGPDTVPEPPEDAKPTTSEDVPF